jgi:dTDP-glucose 4,6-dehydratase
MRINDGRAIPAFFNAAIRDEPLPIHGDGTQTRSLCYVEDEVEGLLRLMVSEHTGPINIGNPQEVTMLELAEKVQAAVGNHPGVAFHPRPVDDPKVRRPDTTLAESLLGWKAQISLDEGLRRTTPWFRDNIAR